ncbi:hypothetical protein [Streptomyces carpinensis]|uniref:Uncharacterized protein n=1 Tax=Streptomyces carpinensis TaxID=66369 RepID=A0ABV1W2T8_9ACTN|nr:hypothetical protein [Streptomyces carpinensis]
MREPLPPAGGTAFALGDLLALPLKEVIAIAGRTPRAGRKLASWVRRHIGERRRRETVSGVRTRVVAAFRTACHTGDLATVLSLLDRDVTLIGDGGGKGHAPLNPIHGADRTARFLLGGLWQQPGVETTLHSVNGGTGLVLRHDDRVCGVVSFTVRHEKITAVWLVLNPDKLRSWNRR